MDAEEAGQSAGIITRSALFLYTNKPMDAAGPKKRKEMKQNRPTWLSWQTRKTRLDQTASLYFNASSPLSLASSAVLSGSRGARAARLGPTASRKDGDRSIDRRGPPGVLARLVEINSWSVK